MLRTWIGMSFPLLEDCGTEFADWWLKSRSCLQMNYNGSAFDSLCLMNETLGSLSIIEIYKDIREEILIWSEAGIFKEIG
uniref:Uncharacterized protein n=1 Tax=Oryza punctata TaxID=4537 RepID=A0A0E0JN66_ORYPU